MIIRSMELVDFKSFRGIHIFNFDRPPGLYFLRGRNEAEPNLGANGAGKSTIFDALCWGLYGKSLRNLKAGTIHGWDSEQSSTWVNLALRDDQDNIDLIHRAWSPNSLLLNGEFVVQDRLTRHLGIDDFSFKHSIIHPQFGDMFFDLAATPKLQLFSSVLNLDYWMSLSDLAKTKANSNVAAVATFGIKISKYEGRLATVSDNIKEFIKAKKVFASVQKDAVKDVALSIKNLNRKLKDADMECTDIEKKLNKIKKRRNFFNEEELKWKKKRAKLDQKLANTIRYKNDLTGTIHRLVVSIGNIERVGGVCSVCKQKVSKIHIKEQINDFELKEKESRKLLKPLDQELENLEDQMEVIRDSLKNLKSAQNDTHSKIRKFEIKHAQLGRDVEFCQQGLTDQKRSLRKIKNKENPHDIQIKKAKAERKKIKSRIDKLQGKIDKAQKKVSGYEHWIKGFKDVRLFLLEECITQLEVEVNNNLMQLGLDDWSIRFDVEKETKSGTISTGFQVQIKSPKNKDVVPWEVWSGGEGQRLRLAGTMGLSNLILNRSGVVSNIEVWDEPTQYLNRVDDLLDLLYQRAQDLQKQIWLVDHRSIDFGGFEDVVTIVKDKNGSRIEQ